MTINVRKVEQQERLYTVSETAERLGVTVTTLWRWRRAGLITARVRGRWIRFTEADIQAFLEASATVLPRPRVRRSNV